MLINQKETKKFNLKNRQQKNVNNSLKIFFSLRWVLQKNFNAELLSISCSFYRWRKEKRKSNFILYLSVNLWLKIFRNKNMLKNRSNETILKCKIERNDHEQLKQPFGKMNLFSYKFSSVFRFFYSEAGRVWSEKMAKNFFILTWVMDDDDERAQCLTMKCIQLSDATESIHRHRL